MEEIISTQNGRTESDPVNDNTANAADSTAAANNAANAADETASEGPAVGSTYAGPPPPAATGPQTFRRLYRTSGPISGVAGGLADYFNIDASLVRVALVAGTLLGGPIVPIGYIAAWLIIPQANPAPVAPVMAAPPAPAPTAGPVPPAPGPFTSPPFGDPAFSDPAFGDPAFGDPVPADLTTADPTKGDLTTGNLTEIDR